MNRSISRTLLLALLTTTLVLGGAPVAQAEDYGAGTSVKAGDADHTPWPASQHTKASLCAIDSNGDGSYSQFEPLYIDIDTTTCALYTEYKDIRLTASGDLKPGKEVGTADADKGHAMITVMHYIRYTDIKNKGKYDSSSGLYFDLLETSLSRVGVGDLRILPVGSDKNHTAFSFVKAGDPDVDVAYKEIKAGGVTVNTDSVLYKAGSAYYVNTDAGVINTADYGVEDKDVRLSNKAAGPTGGGTATGAPKVKISGLGVFPATPVAGQAFRVSAKVTNDDSVSGSALVETYFGADVVDARGTPTLAPKGAANLVMTLIAPATSFDLKIGDQTLKVTVSAPAKAETPTVNSDSVKVVGGEQNVAAPDEPVQKAQEAPGFDAALLMLLVGVALLMVRNRRTIR